MRFELPQPNKSDISNDIDVLLIGNNYHDSLEASYFFAFKKLGFTPYLYGLNEFYETFNFKLKNKLLSSGNFLRKYFPSVKYIDKNFLKKKYKIIVVFSLTLINEGLIKKLKQLTDNFFFIYADNPLYEQYKQSELLNNSKLFDAVFLWSSKLVQNFKKYNQNCFFLDFAWDSNIFPNSIKNNKSNNLIFIGGWDKYRETKIKEILNVGMDIKIYGPTKYWSKISFLKKYYNYELRSSEASEVICNNISLNINREQNDIVGGLNMRVYETIGSGGILITNKVEGLKNISEELFNYLSFKEIKEVKEIYSNILDKYNFYNDIRIQLFETIKQNHTYVNRVNKILEIVK